MRRRLLGSGGSKQQSATAKGTVDRRKAADLPSSGPSAGDSLASGTNIRRTITRTEDTTATDYSNFLAENKYATIGGGTRTKWPLMRGGGGSEKALNGGAGRPSGGRPRSMGAAQMGVKCCGAAAMIGTEAETAFGGGSIGVVPPPPPPHATNHSLIAGKHHSLVHPPHNSPLPGLSSSMSAGGPMSPPPIPFQPGCSSQNNNRNSTGSTNSSQTSSGFESQSAKSSSSHQLAQSASSGSCSSSSAHHPHHHPQLPCGPILAHSSCSPADPASPSSRLSSTGSSTQGGRSSAYFSLSDGLDSSIGPGGTLIGQQKGANKGKGVPRVNIGEMMAKGIPEPEIFAEWLQRLCLSEYLTLFLAQGYDLRTLARATPEDLTTLGITKPEDRKRLVQDIQCWRNVRDEWPEGMAREANIRDWLETIGLKQYVDQFEQQGYLSVGELEQLEAEDLEDIGVHKLGHIKRIWLALKKLKASRAAAQQHLAAQQQVSSMATLRPSTLANCTAPPSSSASIVTLRRHSQPHQPTPPRLENGPPRIRGEPIGQEGGNVQVQFRNSSFGIEPNRGDEKRGGGGEGGEDRGPPRLNLYRTSQIIAQLPREPPPELLDEDNEPRGAFFIGHIPPPPAPFPSLSPTLPPYTSSNWPPPPPSFFGAGSFSQPATPRNAQKMFSMAANVHQQFAAGHRQDRPQMDQILVDLGRQLDGIVYSSTTGNGQRKMGRGNGQK